MGDHVIIQKLKASPVYPLIRDALADLPGWSDVDDMMWLGMTISRALAGPRSHERFTRSERHKIADKIASHAKELAELLYQVHGSQEVRRDWPFEFQASIDRMALAASIDFRESTGHPEDSELAASLQDPEGDSFHVARAGIYHALIECMPETLETLSDAAQWWKDSGSQPLAKPNHKNAARLYFIRVLTEYFVRHYGRPMRELTLNLTSVYFDCADLELAALSNLAPVTDEMKKLHEMHKRIKNVKLSEMVKRG